MIHLISPVCKVSVFNYAYMAVSSLFFFLTVKKKDKHNTVLIMHLFNDEDIYNITKKKKLFKGVKSLEFQYGWHKHMQLYIT